MKLEEIFKEKSSLIVFIVISLVLILISFRIGVFVGQRQASFTYRWGENYHQAFGGPQEGFMQDWRGKDFVAGHGNVGQVIKNEDEILIIQDKNGTEKIIKLDQKTLIKNGPENIKQSDIEINDEIVVLGSPQDDGSVLAKLIRVFDLSKMPPPQPLPQQFLPEMTYPKFKR